MTVRGPAAEQFLDQVQRAMDVISRRQQLVASNVGNIDTPGYKTVDLDFDKAISQAVESNGSSVSLRRTDSRHMAGRSGAGSGGPASEVDDLAIRPDGNNVSLDREMMNLSQTKHRYEIAANAIRHRMHLLKYAIMEGKGG